MVAIGYFCGVIFIWLLFPLPAYSGPTKFFEITTEDEFNTYILQQKAKKNPKVEPAWINGVNPNQFEDITMWFVEFYTTWADTCILVNQTK